MFKSTLSRIAAGIELRNQEELARIKADSTMLQATVEIEVAKRLQKIQEDKARLEEASAESGIDYLAQARAILNKLG
ncbi:MAG: hypothetical protein LC099_12745 [Anaerolineales bacterium]|nr:hypothetical protein [Anaerolineales bacterium]